MNALRSWSPTVGKFDMSEVTHCRIRNSMQLNRAILTENLLPEIESNPALEVIGEPMEMEFDEEGNLAGVARAGL